MVGTRGNKTAIQQRPPHASQIVSPLPTAERPAPQSNALKEKILPKEDGFNPKLVKSFRIQCRCKHCSGILEFVDINAGKGALCPHCGKETVLFIPAGAQCTCNNCAAELDFDVSDAGATIQCPICSKETVLLVPGGSRMKPVSTVSGTPSLWNPNAAANWSLIFTPAFSAFLHAQNADVLGRVKEAKANRIWLYASLVFLGLVTVSCFFPQLPDGVVSLGGLVLLFGWYLSLGRKQIKFVQETWQNRYHKKSWTNPLLIAFGSLCGFVILAMFLRAYP